MTYTLGIPADGQSLASSKPQIRTNFTVINNAFAVNHFPFSSSGEGKHKFVQLPQIPNVTVAAVPTTGTSEGAIYTKAVNAFTNLFWRQESGGADPKKNQGEEIQLTNIAPTNAQKGSTFLPGGLLIQWDLGSTNGAGNKSFSYENAFSLLGVPTNAWSIQVQLAEAGSVLTPTSFGITAQSPTGFSINSFNGVSSNVFYIAIGPCT